MGAVIAGLVIKAIGEGAKAAADATNEGATAPSTSSAATSRPQPAGGTMDSLKASDVISQPDRNGSAISMPNYQGGVNMSDLSDAVGAAIVKK